MAYWHIAADRFPFAAAGNRIGLYGGSFNPAHKGHLHVALTALRRLDLDQIWFIISPQNPLKSGADLPPIAARAQIMRPIFAHPKFRLTWCESRLPSSYSYQLIETLKSQRPDLHFVWVMGADSLVQFHQWRHWRRIIHLVPLAIIDRPHSQFAPLHAKAAQCFSRFRLPERHAKALSFCQSPAWCMLKGPLTAISSSDIRKCGKNC